MFEHFFSSSKQKEPENVPVGSVNALKSEHLNAGVRPIIAGVGTREDFQDKEQTMAEMFSKNDDTVDNVNYYGNHKRLTRRNFKNPSDWSYVISPISDKDKMSCGYLNCTGVAVSGADKKTGKNISFLSHQDPKYFLEEENMDMFLKDMKEQTIEMKERCVSGTIDAVIFGGNYFTGGNAFDEGYRKRYENSIKTLSSGLGSILGFAPPVIVGPKMEEYGEDVYFDNANRRLYMVRPKVGNSTTESYLPKDINEQEKKWTAE